MSIPSWAASSEISISFILFQTLNFTIFSALLIYLVIQKVPPVLKLQYEDYLMNKKKAKKMYEKAYQELEETKNKIVELEKKEALFSEEVEVEIQKLEDIMVSELNFQKEAILRSAQNAINLELISLKQKLKEEYLNQVIYLCEKQSQNQSYDISSLSHKISEKKLKGRV